MFLCSDVREVKSVCTQSLVSPWRSFQYQSFVSGVKFLKKKTVSFSFICELAFKWLCSLANNLFMFFSASKFWMFMVFLIGL